MVAVKASKSPCSPGMPAAEEHTVSTDTTGPVVCSRRSLLPWLEYVGLRHGLLPPGRLQLLCWSTTSRRSHRHVLPSDVPAAVGHIPRDAQRQGQAYLWLCLCAACSMDGLDLCGGCMGTQVLNRGSESQKMTGVCTQQPRLQRLMCMKVLRSASVRAKPHATWRVCHQHSPPLDTDHWQYAGLHPAARCWRCSPAKMRSAPAPLAAGAQQQQVGQPSSSSTSAGAPGEELSHTHSRPWDCALCSCRARPSGRSGWGCTAPGIQTRLQSTSSSPCTLQDAQPGHTQLAGTCLRCEALPVQHLQVIKVLHWQTR
jgi:hypothetical protein